MMVRSRQNIKIKKKNTDSNTKTKDKCKHKRKTHKVKIRKRNYDSGYCSQSGISIQLFLGLLYNVPPQKGHNVFSAWVPLNLDLLVQLGSITSRCSGQMSPQPSPLLRVTKDCTQETAEIEPRCNYVPCILSPSKALKDGAVARLGLELDQRTIALHKRTCTCRYNGNQGYYGLLLSLLFALWHWMWIRRRRILENFFWS